LTLGGRKLGNRTCKHIKANVCKKGCTCAWNIILFYFLIEMATLKMVVLLWNGTQYARPKKKIAVRSTHGQNRTVRKGGGGVTLKTCLIISVHIFYRRVACSKAQYRDALCLRAENVQLCNPITWCNVDLLRCMTLYTNNWFIILLSIDYSYQINFLTLV